VKRSNDLAVSTPSKRREEETNESENVTGNESEGGIEIEIDTDTP